MTMIGYMPDEISKVIHDFIRPVVRYELTTYRYDEDGDMIWKEDGDMFMTNNHQKMVEYYTNKLTIPDVVRVKIAIERKVYRNMLKKYRTKTGKRMVVRKRRNKERYNHPDYTWRTYEIKNKYNIDGY